MGCIETSQRTDFNFRNLREKVLNYMRICLPSYTLSDLF